LFNRSYWYLTLAILLLMSTVLPYPSSNAFSASQPTITIDSPSSNAEVNTENIVISGSYSADDSKTDLLFTAYENGNSFSDSLAQKADWTINETGTTKTWSFSTSSLAEGTHTISIKIKRISTNEELTEASITFTIKMSSDTGTSITITDPSPKSVLDSKHVVISGTYTADVPKTELLFTANDGEEKLSDSSINERDWTIDESSTPKKWTFSTTSLEEGDHNITVEIKNLQTTDISKATTNFSLALIRPYVTETRIVLANGTERKGEDLTNVPLGSKLKVTVVDDQKMDHLKSKIEANNYNPIKIILGSNTIEGTTEINELEVQNGKHYYDIIFTPNSSELKINKTYLVYIDPELVDDLENPVFTRLFKFTTMTTAEWNDPDNPISHASSNPHGHYQSNTNMCATCHSTHDPKSPSQIGVSYKTTFREELAAGQPADDPSQNYCMACHDGTINAPIIDKNDSKYRHNNPADYSKEGINTLKNPESCTSCHNPHLNWSEDNPNLLKDHYVYTHNEANPEKGLETPTVDSLDTACETCHEYIDFSKISEEKGKRETLAYKKSLTARGTISNKVTDPTLKTISDYSLCFRCHNPEKSVKNTNTADIETHYLKQNSGHNFVLLADQQTQRDGSMLNGPMPCAECHETHGSNNQFNLREILGNNPSLPAADHFKTVGTVWNEENERNFCLNCHTKGTEIYGKKAAIDKTISGHQDNESKACSECHSDQTKSYKTFREKSMSAAHAPLPGAAH